MSNRSGLAWFIGAGLVGLAMLVRPATAGGLSDGPVLVLPSATPEKVIRALRAERLNPAEATVTARALNGEGLRKYKIMCPIRTGVDRGKYFTILTNSYLPPVEFRGRLSGTD
jgi:hypothetical protein